MPRHVNSRAESMAKWFERNVLQNDRIYPIWKTELLGSKAWLKATPVNMYPKWARNGNRKARFEAEIIKLANRKREEGDGVDRGSSDSSTEEEIVSQGSDDKAWTIRSKRSSDGTAD